MAMPPVIKKILEMSEKLLWVPTIDKISGRFSSEYLDTHAGTDPDRYGAGARGIYGHTALSSSVSSTLGEGDATAATPSAVKTAFDTASLLDTAMTTQRDMGGRPLVPENLRSGGLLIFKED